MTSSGDPPLTSRAQALRREAEARLEERLGAAKGIPSAAETMRLVHELQVHQIELELQNDALRAAQVEIEVGLKHYTELFDFAPIGYFRLRADGTISEANLAAASLVGRERVRLNGARFQSFLDEPSRGDFAAFLTRMFATKGADTTEVRLLSSGSAPKEMVLSGTPSPGDHECLVTMLDVSEQRRMAAEVRASDDRYRRMVESTSEGVITTDAQGHLTFVNARFAQMLGYAPGEMIRRGGFNVVEQAARQIAAARVEQKRLLQHKNGHDVWVRVISSPLYDARGAQEGTLALVSDITESLHAEETRHRLAAIVESSADAIVGTDVVGRVTSWNRGATQLYGYSDQEMLGQPVGRLSPESAADEELDTRSHVLHGGAVIDRHAVGRRKDGSLVDVSLTMSPIHGADAQIVGVSRVDRDLTERHQAEATLRSTEEQLRQSQKLEAIGSLAGGIAHDFNNLLSVILGYASLGLEDCGPDHPLHSELNQIVLAARRGAELTQQLLVFSRRQVMKPQNVDLNQCVRGMKEMLSRVLGAHLRLSVTEAPEQVRTLADRGQLEQLILNLALNARDAMPEGGEIHIETAHAELDAAGAAQHPDARQGSYVVLSVTDHGVGIDAAVLPRIFEPFFTTKDQGKGTGLGLATAYGIVRQCGGHIQVSSVVGQGSTFRVYFPRAAKGLPSLVPHPNVPPPARGTETILLVDDEDLVRGTSAAILRRQGYQVLEAVSAGDALVILEQHGASIRLMVTDVVMPNMNGRQLADRVLALYPALKVLYISGHPKNVFFGDSFVEDTTHAYLEKPLNPQTLVQEVRQLLDGKAACINK